MEKTNKIDNLVNVAMESLKNLVDVNTVMGNPIKTENSTIIPVSKVTMGFITGGGEYGEVKCFKKDENYPFSGGSGAIVSMKPVGFLIDNGKGYKLINVNTDAFEKFLSICEDAVSNLTKND